MMLPLMYCPVQFNSIQQTAVLLGLVLLTCLVSGFCVPRIRLSCIKTPKRRVGTVIGIDLLGIAPLEGAIFLSGCDFTKNETVDKIKEILIAQKRQMELKRLEQSETEMSGIPEMSQSTPEDDALKLDDANNDKVVDVILSDMAPNATGIGDSDHHRIVKLVEAALAFAEENGKPKGHFLAKLWDGSETKRLTDLITSKYEKVTRIKPPSSRNDSSEFFLLGKYKL